MNNFAFYSPTEFVFGKGTESQTAELVKKYKGTKVMIVYGGGSVVRSGLLDKVKNTSTKQALLMWNWEAFSPILPTRKCTKVSSWDVAKESTFCFRWEAVRLSIQPKPLQWVSLTKAISGISI